MAESGEHEHNSSQIIELHGVDSIISGLLRECRSATQVESRVCPFVQRHFGAMVSQISELDNRLKLPAVRLPRVCVYGSTGVGKSTLVNALLGHQVLPASSKITSTTSIATEVRSFVDSTGTLRFDVHIEFVTPKEWKQYRNALAEAVVDTQKSPAANQARRRAGEVLARVYPISCLLDASNKRMTTEAAAAVLATCARRELSEEEDAAGDGGTGGESECSQELIDALAEGEAAITAIIEQGGTNETYLSAGLVMSHLSELNEWQWHPLVRDSRVSIYNGGAACLLPDRCTLVDMPGVADVNASKVQIAELHRKLSTHTWIVTDSIKMASLKEFQNQLQNLALDGSISRAAIVLTKCESHSEGDSATLPQDCRRMITEFLEDCLVPEELAAAAGSMNVTSVSATNYSFLTGTRDGIPLLSTVEQTGIPQLAQQLQQLADENATLRRSVLGDAACVVEDSIQVLERFLEYGSVVNSEIDSC